ncbi:hypothetical protein Ahy_B09g095969 isoform N [Arachis hypogaea]|uniref:Aminotransferase-like plant mobile domain-containing protein n=1 Tax=Arachis hypogaea TaxID=3818 RepID=A0A444XIB8_ARAHY|nr:hypothetical protein Ahy_B09g095969 isoform N [Arachis hypogaea]
MLFGECTITLQDVAYQLGLPVDGHYVSGCLSEFHIYIEGGRPAWVWFEELFGVVPPPSQVQKYAVNCSWFQETFGECPEGADEDTVRRYARAYIMMLLGTQLFADKSGNRVHIRWLPFVARLEEMGSYSWGSAALAWLYRCMCRVANRNVIKLAGPLQLLQSWIFWRFPRFRPAGFETFSWPLASRWSGYIPSSSEKGPRVQTWRLWIDRLQDREFIWMPYSSPDVLQVLHPEVLEPRHMVLWRSVTSLIYFAVIEWHQVDRVLPQFWQDFLGADTLDPDFGSPRFLAEISAIMQEDEPGRRRPQTPATQAPLDVDLNEPATTPVGDQFALGGTPHSAYTAASQSIAGPSVAPLHFTPPAQPTPHEDADEIEDEEPFIRRGQRPRVPRRCGTGSHLFR